jgi:hypothetical protein
MELDILSLYQSITDVEKRGNKAKENKNKKGKVKKRVKRRKLLFTPSA